MLMHRLLDIDGFGVKTRSSNWNYRGPALLYTSGGRPHKVPVKAYGLNPDEFPSQAIVEVATVVDCQLLTGYQRLKMLCNCNKVDRETAIYLPHMGVEYIEPRPFGLFLKDIRRFEKPVPFTPKQGAIMRVPLNLVAKALKKVGIDSAQLS